MIQRGFDLREGGILFVCNRRPSERFGRGAGGP